MDMILRLARELRWLGNSNDLHHEVCNAVNDAADALDLACKLAEAVENYTKEPNARNWTEVLHARKAFK